MDIDAEVDELMATTQRQPQLSTDTYSQRFFADRAKRSATAQECMQEARFGLEHFIKEAETALATDELTVEQRIHIATIVSYVDGLARRFDKIRAIGEGT